MKNRNLSFTLTGRTKLFLFICLGAAAVVDLTALIYLTAEGMDSYYWLFPLLFFIADALFLVQAVFSNYRFKYTIIQIIFYIVFSFLVFVNMLDAYYGHGIEFTSSAKTVWVILHILSLASALSCYIFTAKLSKRGRAHGVISVIFGGVSAIMALAYVVSVIAVGFFGQGAYNRPLAYEYNEETDTYSVIGVIPGKSNSIYIPAEFDGKKIDKVWYGVFSEINVDYVTLGCATDVEFTGRADKTSLSTVYAPKENLDIFKHTFYSAGEFDIANAMTPYGLEENEVYATFKYSEEDYRALGGEIFDTWYGKSGDMLSLSYFKDIDYAEHTDITSDNDLYWNFYNNEKRILSSLDFDGNNIINSSVAESIDGAEVEFERIYRLYPGSSNDEKYSMQQNFEYSEIDGVKLDCKLITGDKVSAYLEGFNRNGFNLTTNVTGGDDKYVQFVWELKAPEVTATSNREHNTVTYGDPITLSANAKAPADDLILSYEWYDSVMRRSYAQNYVINQMPYGNQKYTVHVTASGDHTSLTSLGFAQIDVTVEKRILTLSWTYPQSNVYDGTYKEISCRINEEIIAGDNVRLVQDLFRYKDAGTYSPVIGLSGYDIDKYSIVSGEPKSYTIEKAGLTVDWTTTELVYNGQSQRPEFNLMGLQGEDAVTNYSLSGGINAGTYNVQLAINDSFIKNYNLKNITTTLTITQFPLNVVWRSDLPDTFVYDANDHAIQASAVGAGGNPVPLTYSRAWIKNAGEYTVMAYVSNTNYVIATGGTHTYKITPYGLTVNWIQTTLTYNGEQQGPEYRLTGIGGDGGILAGGNGLKKDVGEGYVFTITHANDSNYYIADNASTTFKIIPASVAVQWTVPYMMYDGKTQAPTAHIAGLGDDAKISLKCTTTGAVNAGTHVSTATLDHVRANNYILTDTTRSFTIDRKPVGVVVDDVTITYGEAVPETFIYSITQVAEGDKEEEVVTNVKFEIEGYSGGYILPGTYNILATADVTSNYTFVLNTAGKLIVERAKLTLRIDNKEITYGDDLPEFTFTVEEGAIIGDDVIIVSYKLNKEVDGADEYIIEPVWGDDAGKYDCGIHHGKLTVKEADNGV